MPSRPTIAIIGAGPAGLTVAYFLAQQDLRPTVFEGGKDIGGLAGAVELWGRSYDIGPHTFLDSSQPQAVRLWNDIGGEDLARMTLSRGMVLNRRMLRFPPEPMDLLHCMGWLPFVAAGLGACKARWLDSGDVLDAGSFFHSRYGEQFRALVFNPFCEKYLGLADSCVDLAFAKSLTSFVEDGERAAPAPATPKRLLYPRRGGSKLMWSRIAERVRRNGAIVLGRRLDKVMTQRNRITRLCFDDGSSVEPDFVVSTLPIGTLLHCLDRCPAAVREEGRRLASRNTVLVYLRVAGPVFAHHYVTVFDRSLAVGRITNFGFWTDRPEATSGEDAVLCMEYWCDAGDATWTAPDAEMTAKATLELEQAAGVGREQVRAAHVIRIPHSHPVVDTAHHASLAAINDYLDQFQNLALAGRHATFKWDGQADNIVAGMKLAERIGERLQGTARSPAATSSAVAETSAGSPR